MAINTMKHSPQKNVFPGLLPTLLLLLIVLPGCSKLNCTGLENLLGKPADLIEFSYSIADNLVDRANPPLVYQNPEMAVLLTTFVDNNNLESTNRFGKLLQEHIGSRLVQIGYSVKELKLAKSLNIEPGTGETMLTRDLTKLEGTQNAQAILVGTYSRTSRRLYISARLINPTNNTIIASDDYRLCMDSEMLDLFGLKIDNASKTVISEPNQPFLNKIL
jgi:TolB-like protein